MRTASPRLLVCLLFGTILLAGCRTRAPRKPSAPAPSAPPPAFQQAEALFVRYQQIRYQSDMSAPQREHVQSMKEEWALRCFHAYDRVSQRPPTDWSQAAFFRKGQIFESFASFLQQLPVALVKRQTLVVLDRIIKKRNLSKAEADTLRQRNAPKIIQGVLQKYRRFSKARARPYQARALKHYKQCVKLAQRSSIQSTWAVRAQEKIVLLQNL